MRAIVELEYEVPDVPAGTIMGVVEILDASLVRVAQVALRARTSVPVRLPATGRYLVRGWLPNGGVFGGRS